jgi:hypothetical protein
MTIDCMSSEESSTEHEDTAKTDGETAAVRSNRGILLTTRPPPWRSGRLERLYDLLDSTAAQLPHSSAQRPRGMGKKARVRGPPREPRGGSGGIFFPPKGVRPWMVAKHWKRDAKKVNPLLEDLLKSLVIQEDEGDNSFEWELLGASSDDE